MQSMLLHISQTGTRLDPEHRLAEFRSCEMGKESRAPCRLLSRTAKRPCAARRFWFFILILQLAVVAREEDRVRADRPVQTL
jgi:hypothetical protein